LNVKGFTISSGTTTLKLSRYVIDFNDKSFGHPKWEIGYRGAFQMKIGITAEAPMLGKSNMKLVADEIQLGRIYVKGLDGAGVLTTLTDPIADYITGMRHMGSRSVFAIS
jgi:hypothetical protein